METTPTDLTSSSIDLRDIPRADIWHRVALGAIASLAIFLHFFRLNEEGFANLYYAATVKSMLTSWHNFFFASFDPGGFVSVDKPPLGLWLQAASALIFGFSGWSLLLPQALAGVLSVLLLYHLVARVFGANAGLVAALTLAATPISIAANRNNTMDSQLVFTSLLAAWMVSIAVERGRLRWLLLGALFVGIGFNIKMLQAFMILPALWLVYLIAARTKWYWRVVHLALATLALAIVSFAWVVVVDLTPPDQRPFVGSSRDNTEMELIVGHNGIARLGAIANWLGLRNAPPARPNLPPQNFSPPPSANQPGQPPQGQPGQPQPPPQPPRGGPTDETGEPGILRLFNKQLAGQISWLLPLAALGFFAAAFATRLSYPFARAHQQLMLWGMWLASQVVFFSFAGLFHRYYLEMLAPAIAALVGAGIAAMWDAYARQNWRGIVLPCAILASAAIQAVILLNFSDWNGWLIPFVIVAGVITATALVVLILLPAARAIRFLQAATVAVGILALLAAPTVWSLTPLMSADVGLPFAGPELATRPPRPSERPGENRLIDFLRANRAGAKFLVATLNAGAAAPIILATGEPVMTIGGFGGNDQILSADQVAQAVANNTVRFFWLSPQGNQQAEITRWVSANCARAQTGARQLPAPDNPQLYDCRRR